MTVFHPSCSAILVQIEVGKAVSGGQRERLGLFFPLPAVWLDFLLAGFPNSVTIPVLFPLIWWVLVVANKFSKLPKFGGSDY